MSTLTTFKLTLDASATFFNSFKVYLIFFFFAASPFGSYSSCIDALVLKTLPFFTIRLPDYIPFDSSIGWTFFSIAIGAITSNAASSSSPALSSLSWGP